MIWVVVVLFVVIMLFSFVILFGAPYLPTLSKQQETALDLLDLKPGQTLLELGSGDGRMLIAAAKRDIKATGYELNPLLAGYSWLVTRKYRRLITVKCTNFWSRPLTNYDGIYVFLLDRFMPKLDKKITQEKPNSVKLVSFAFEFPGKKPVTEKNGLYLYKFTTRSKD